jgi:hypothetical protein
MHHYNIIFGEEEICIKKSYRNGGDWGVFANTAGLLDLCRRQRYAEYKWAAARKSRPGGAQQCPERMRNPIIPKTAELSSILT